MLLTISRQDGGGSGALTVSPLLHRPYGLISSSICHRLALVLSDWEGHKLQLRGRGAQRAECVCVETGLFLLPRSPQIKERIEEGYSGGGKTVFM